MRERTREDSNTTEERERERSKIAAQQRKEREKQDSNTREEGERGGESNQRADTHRESRIVHDKVPKAE